MRVINKPWTNCLYCDPHSFHLSGPEQVGADIAAMTRYVGDKLAHVHVAGIFYFKASSGERYILDPSPSSSSWGIPQGTPARIHQHLDIGQGEVDWNSFFGILRELSFDGGRHRLCLRLGGAGTRALGADAGPHHQGAGPLRGLRSGR